MRVCAEGIGHTSSVLRSEGRDEAETVCFPTAQALWLTVWGIELPSCGHIKLVCKAPALLVLGACACACACAGRLDI